MKFESLISIGEAASRIGVSIDTLRRWDKSGKLKAIRKNNIRYYSEKEIGVYIVGAKKTHGSSARGMN